MTSLFLPVICFGLRRVGDDGQSLGCDEESLGKISPKSWKNGIVQKCTILQHPMIGRIVFKPGIGSYLIKMHGDGITLKKCLP